MLTFLTIDELAAAIQIENEAEAGHAFDDLECFVDDLDFRYEEPMLYEEYRDCWKMRNSRRWTILNNLDKYEIPSGE